MNLGDFLSITTNALQPLMGPDKTAAVIKQFADKLTSVFEGPGFEFLLVESCLDYAMTELLAAGVNELINRADLLENNLVKLINQYTLNETDAKAIAKNARLAVTAEIAKGGVQQAYSAAIVKNLVDALNHVEKRQALDLSFGFECDEILSDYEDLIIKPYLDEKNKIISDLSQLLKPVENALKAEGAEYLYLRSSLRESIFEKVLPLVPEINAAMKEQLIATHSSASNEENLSNTLTVINNLDNICHEKIDKPISDAVSVWSRDKQKEILEALKPEVVVNFIYESIKETVLNDLLNDGLVKLAEMYKPVVFTTDEFAKAKAQLLQVLHFTKKHHLEILLDNDFSKIVSDDKNVIDVGKCFRELLQSLPDAIQQVLCDPNTNASYFDNPSCLEALNIQQWKPDQYHIYALENPLFSQVRLCAQLLQEVRARAKLEDQKGFAEYTKMHAEQFKFGNKVDEGKVKSLVVSISKHAAGIFNTVLRGSNLVTLQEVWKQVASIENDLVGQLKLRMAELEKMSARQNLQSIESKPLFAVVQKSDQGDQSFDCLSTIALR